MRKFNLFSIALICAGMIFAGCNKKSNDPDGFINAKVENGNSYDFDIVKAIMEYDDGHMTLAEVVAEGEYKNGGFSLNLPETINPMYLSLMYDDEPLPGQEITISDETVMGNGIFIEAYKSGVYMGDFNYVGVTFEETTLSISFSISQGFYLYVDKDLTMSGSEYVIEEFLGIDIETNINADVALKKGWNIMYVTLSFSIGVGGASGTGLVSTKNPGGLKWYFEDDYLNDLDLGGTTMEKSSQSKAVSQYHNDIQKIISKYRFFPNSN